MVDVVPLEGAIPTRAAAYPVRDPNGWRALLERGGADAFGAFDAAFAENSAPKACCSRDPGHAGSHDVVDPLQLG